MQFHEKLYSLRKAKNMTQTDLAERLNVSRQAVSRWEMGTAKPEVDTLIAMSDLFGVTLDELLKNREESPKQEDAEPPVSGPSYWQCVPKFWWVFAVIGIGWKLLQRGLKLAAYLFPEWAMDFTERLRQSDMKHIAAYVISYQAMSAWAKVFFFLAGLCFFWALVRWIRTKQIRK